mmetsp:Transcript_7332/g.17688  ORF Transcript_7332/g.17688 Transcript_7332/m.17688 type:complete len:205 (-) Transcript_7332:121-735(-)
MTLMKGTSLIVWLLTSTRTSPGCISPVLKASPPGKTFVTTGPTGLGSNCMPYPITPCPRPAWRGDDTTPLRWPECAAVRARALTPTRRGAQRTAGARESSEGGGRGPGGREDWGGLTGREEGGQQATRLARTQASRQMDSVCSPKKAGIVLHTRDVVTSLRIPKDLRWCSRPSRRPRTRVSCRNSAPDPSLQLSGCSLSEPRPR